MKTSIKRHGLLVVSITMVVVAMLFGGCHDECTPEEKQHIADSVMTEILGGSNQQHLISPDFTDLGVGSLLSSARMRMNPTTYPLLVEEIVKVLKNSVPRLTAPQPDICMPPNHWGLYGNPVIPPPIPWNPTDPKLVSVLGQTNITVINQVRQYMLDFWNAGRSNGVPSDLTFEMVGLNMPGSLPPTPPLHGFSSVTPPPPPTSTYRVVLNY